MLGAHVDRAAEIVGAVARMSLVPVFAKLPLHARPRAIARAVVRAGANGLTIGGSPPALDIESIGSVRARGGHRMAQRPRPPPLTLRAVFDVSRAVPETRGRGRRYPNGSDAVEAPARRRVGGPGRHGGADRPGGARRDRAGHRALPEGEGARVARRRPRCDFACRRVRRGSRRGRVIPRPDEPADRRARCVRSRPAERLAPRSRPTSAC